MNKKQIEFEMQALAAIDGLRRDMIGALQPQPAINNKSSALVALATPEIMLSFGGLGVGIVAAAGVQFGSAAFVSTGQVFSFSTLTGCTFALLVMGAQALDFPAMFSAGLDWIGEQLDRRREHQIELASIKTKIIERPVVLNPGEDMPEMWDIYDTPQASYSIVIKEETARAKQVKWSYAKLWYFIEDCHRTGKWSRAKARARWGNDNLSQSEHKAIYDFIKAKCPASKTTPALWGLKGEKNLPTLHAYLARFRMPPNQLSNPLASQPEVNQ